jgi:EAL domain-containing protein (putative c-di-GMP-specific phosphodiesterase class I)
MAGRVGIYRSAAISCWGVASAIRREPVLWLALSGGLLIAAIAIATTLAIGEFREQALYNSERELKNTALLLARHFEQQFEDCEIISNDLISKMRFSETTSPEEFKSRISGDEAHLLLKSKASPLSYMGELGEWVLRTACAEAAAWPQDVRLAVNVSPVQLKYRTLPLKIASALAASGLPADRLEIEITEAVLIRDDETALSILHQLRKIGVRIALDDFGTGYSSLSYLKRFPFDKIKIDRSFVGDIVELESSAAIVQAVVNIASSRHMTTTAEGVETVEQREKLRALGCTEMQGYLFSAARPGAEVRQLFGNRRPSPGLAVSA